MKWFRDPNEDTTIKNKKKQVLVNNLHILLPKKNRVK